MMYNKLCFQIGVNYGNFKKILYSRSYGINIKGTITTEGFNNPIENAKVSIESKSTRTNQNGNYSINEISEGTPTWKVLHAEYNDYIEEIIIDNDKIINTSLS